MNRVIVGIDPGRKGGICEYWKEPGCDEPTYSTIKMPDTEADIASVLRKYDPSITTVYLEKVNSRPTDTPFGAFRFGWNYGMLRMALVMMRIPFHDLPPKQWQDAYGLYRRKDESQTAWKNRIKTMAQQLHPEMAKITLYTCDAILITDYAVGHAEAKR